MRPGRAPDWIPGNCAELLLDGEGTFPPMLDAIRRAQSHVHCEVYIVRDDRIGNAFADAFIERARAGVPVRFVYDGMGSYYTPESFFQRMREGGVQVVAFHPLAPWKRNWGIGLRNHRKNLVIDNQIGFAGGLNFDLCHASRSQGGAGWRDTHLLVRGPAVNELNRRFLETWLRVAPDDRRPGADEIAEMLRPAPACGSVDVQVVANTGRPGRRPIRRAYIEALESAKRYAWITNPYFLPDARLVSAMVGAARRGVDVRVLVPVNSDVPVVDIAARPTLRYLLYKGVRVFQWTRSVLHAKTAVIDDRWSTVGSFNLEQMSFQNLELNVMLRDAPFAHALATTFKEDLRRCGELVPVAVDRTPVHVRLAESLLHGVRGWL